MVQLFLKLAALILLVQGLLLARGHAKQPVISEAPTLDMDGGRRLVFDRSFSSTREVGNNHGFWTKLKDAVVGEPEYHEMARPYSVAEDSRGRIIVTDPGAYGLHVFDFAQKKYKFLSHTEGADPMRAPQCVAVDQQDSIYVTDPEAGKVFVFGENGKFQRAIGSLKGGEGMFKRPTGIAIDSAAQRIYVSDTWRDKIFVLDMQGAVIQTIGKTGHADGEFNYPTELRIAGKDLIVVDAMNFRVQVFDLAGAYRYTIAKGRTFRPKGVGVDAEGHIYIADALANQVQVFDDHNQLLYYFGKQTGVGDFELPAGLSVDATGQILVVDTYHRRVQVFHYYGAGGAQ